METKKGVFQVSYNPDSAKYGMEIELQFNTETPEQVHKLINKIPKYFNEAHIETNRNIKRGTNNFIFSQIDGGHWTWLKAKNQETFCPI